MQALVGFVTFNLSNPFFSEKKTAACCKGLRQCTKSAGSVDAQNLVDVVVTMITWI